MHFMSCSVFWPPEVLMLMRYFKVYGYQLRVKRMRL